MICQNAFGHEEEVRQLLIQSLIQTNTNRVDAWMKHAFDPSQMFCFFEDGILTSCLQIKRTTFKFQDQYCRVCTIPVAATLPDYRQRHHFSLLLDAALDQASHNDLLTVVYTSFPKLFLSRSFHPVSTSKTYWISGSSIDQGHEESVRSYTDKDNLYPLYQSFMQCFDGSILYSKEEFENKLSLAKDQRKKVLISMDSDQKPNGFMILRPYPNYAKIEMIQYLHTDAIFNLLKYAGLRFKDISLTVSQDERFEKLLPQQSPRNQGTFLARTNNYKLFSKWIHQDIRNAKQAFELIDKPLWNHF